MAPKQHQSEVHLLLLAMSSCLMRSMWGSYLVQIPESHLTTLELDYGELQQLLGKQLAMEYICCADDCLIWRWSPQYQDTYHGVTRGGWQSFRGWRVQYMFGQFKKSHDSSSSAAVLHHV